jgi:hypothetical protein
MTANGIFQKHSNQKVNVLDNLQLKLDIERLMSRLRFSPASALTQERVVELTEIQLSNTQSRAFYRSSQITAKSDRALEIYGVAFSNAVLRFNLDKASLIFPFCLTVVDRIEGAENPASGMAEEYCINVIKEWAAEKAFDELQNHLTGQYHLAYLWSLVSGEIEAWPPSGRKELFQLLREAHKTIGVKLQPDFSLFPASSRCGFFYYAETEFEGCQVCSKEPCMMRRAQYNAALASKKGLKIRKVCGRDTA